MYDLAVIDEFRGSDKPLGWLNLWLQGNPMPLRKKGSQYTKEQNIPTIILSNYSPREAYSKVPDHILGTLLSRLEVISVTNIHFDDDFWPKLGRPQPKVLVPDTQKPKQTQPSEKDEEIIEISDSDDDDRPTELNLSLLSQGTPPFINQFSDDEDDEIIEEYDQSPII